MEKCVGLLLDFGGVLTTSVIDSFARFCESEDIDVDTFRSVVVQNARAPESIFAAVEVGKIEQEKFDEMLADLLSKAIGKTVASQGLKQRMFAASRPDEEMLAAVRRARAQGVRTALVSNSWGGNDYPRDQFAELFDEVVISGEVGLRKPDPEIYVLASSKLGVEPASCAFVDDFKVNIEGAEAVGMTGILHRRTIDTIARIERLFAVELTAGESR